MSFKSYVPDKVQSLKTLGNNSKIRQRRIIVFAMHFYFMRTIFTRILLLIHLVLAELCPGQSSMCKLNKGQQLRR